MAPSAVPRGVVVNHRYSWSVNRMIESGAQYIRSLVYNTEEFAAQLADVSMHHIPAVATINNQNDTVQYDWSGWRDAANDFVRLIRPEDCPFIVLINEPDIWKLNPGWVANLVNQVAPIYHRAGFKVCLPSVAGEHWQAYLTDLVNMVDLQHISAATAHFYGQSPDGVGFQDPSFGWLREAIADAHQISGLPVVLDEIGVKLRDVASHPLGAEMGQAEYVEKLWKTLDSIGAEGIPVACYFALEDSTGTPDEQGDQAFGLYRPSDGYYRPAFYEFQLAAERYTPRKEPSVSLRPHDAQRRIFKDFWNYAVSGIDFNPEVLAICRYWVEHHSEMGSPISAETHDSDGNAYQTFVSGPWMWEAATGEVRRLTSIAEGE